MDYKKIISENSKTVLNRAKLLLSSEEIGEIEIVDLATLMNEYIDFLEVIKSSKITTEHIKKERVLSNKLIAYCDQIEYPKLSNHKIILKK